MVVSLVKELPIPRQEASNRKHRNRKHEAAAYSLKHPKNLVFHVLSPFFLSIRVCLSDSFHISRKFFLQTHKLLSILYISPVQKRNLLLSAYPKQSVSVASGKCSFIWKMKRASIQKDISSMPFRLMPALPVTRPNLCYAISIG